MTTITIPSRTTARAAQASLAGLELPTRHRLQDASIFGIITDRWFAADGIDGRGYCDPLDEPCVPGRQPLWPGGPCLPRWAELEGAAAPPEPQYTVVARGVWRG